jgi:hypothetical protein
MAERAGVPTSDTRHEKSLGFLCWNRWLTLLRLVAAGPTGSNSRMLALHYEVVEIGTR